MKDTKDTNETRVNRTYKSTVFAMLFTEKENLLELYNAISGKHYTDPELLEVNTLENAIYMSMRNDISFVVDGRLSLYEHQSTYSPNLPLRFLFYISNLYSGMTREANLYGTRTVKIPGPEFLIFYNGREEMPERQVLRLSDMFTAKGERCGLELEAVMLNLCGEHNRKLKEACRSLRDYAEYTDRIRKYVREMELEDAVERAIRECIGEGILKEFLEKHRAEAKSMSIFEYDQEKHMRMEREEAWEEGHAQGHAEGHAEGFAEGQTELLQNIIRKKLKKGENVSRIATDLEADEAVIRKFVKEIEEAEKQNT
ncbi:hypothetical protein [Clostridium sp. Marseille-P3244]|uniref:hypothetical protein n=1 Tax=Clostridium sp. Marseille-P3244 TaxID=1871020 RepID=UPI00092FFC0A|nr:hypothetical protein [Clostridium sp. Marseille-P3244]